MAAATATWPRWVLCRPIYRQRRKPIVRTRLRMGSFNACPMAIDLASRPSCSLAGVPLRAPAFALLGARSGYVELFPYRKSDWDRPYRHGCRKFHLDQRFACVLDRCPARTDPALWTGDCLRFPIDGEVREVVAGLCLIPMRASGWGQSAPLHSWIDSGRDQRS